MPSGLFYLNSLDRSIASRKSVWLIFYYHHVLEIPVFNANIVNPDQTPHYAVSDLVLHRLPINLYRTLSINGIKIHS